MIAAFPIGWTVSRLMLAAMFYVIFTPVGLVFRLIGRDALRLRRPGEAVVLDGEAGADEPEQYFRQS